MLAEPEPATFTITGNGSGAVSTTTITFACPRVLTYTVVGGSGGADAGTAFQGAGKGASLIGTISVPAGTTPSRSSRWPSPTRTTR